MVDIKDDFRVYSEPINSGGLECSARLFTAKRGVTNISKNVSDERQRDDQ